MKTATSSLMAASGEVIDQADQYEVFNDPRAVRLVFLTSSSLTDHSYQSDPTHSFLSKDHFVRPLHSVLVDSD